MNRSYPLPALGFRASLAVITAIAAILRAWGLAGQPALGDDAAAAYAAVAFVERGEIAPLMWHHPHLRDLAVYVSMTLLGPTKIGLVLPSALAGIGSVATVGLLGRRVGGPAAGLIAAALVSIDPLHVHYSRQAVHDVYMTLFGAGGVLLAMTFADTGRKRWLAAAGVAFGLGLSSKWALAAPLGVTLLWSLALETRPSPPGARVSPARAAFILAALTLLPAAVYLATWAPWFAQGRTLSDWATLQNLIGAEARGHGGFQAFSLQIPHRAVAWYLWPTWFADFTSGPSGPVPLIAITNPVSWLPTLPAVAHCAWRAWKDRRQEWALIVALFAATWLPFALLSRPIWLHSALAVLPFAMVSVAAAVARLAGDGPRARRRQIAFVAIAAVVSLPLLMLANGSAAERPALRPILERFRPERRFETIDGAQVPPP